MKTPAAFAMLTLVLACSAWAAVPAPPVNQLRGLPDSVFEAFTEADCRLCHNSNPPAGIPVDPTYLPDRHHLLVEKRAIIPPGTAAPHGVVGQSYQCASCHEVRFDPATSTFRLVQNFRNCLVCHKSMTDASGNVLGTVHHATPLAQGGDCVACHGAIVDNMNDGHRIPTYGISLVTPWPSGKPNPGPRGEGNCTYCHSAGIDPLSQVRVSDSMTTHHRTGFGYDASKCLWCHDTQTGVSNIRKCQNCHGIDSLHNIQVESPDPDDIINPGTEFPWYGHIGNQQDCNGCHGFTAAASLGVSPGGRVAPAIDRISKASVPAGVATAVTLTGSAFTSVLKDPSTGAETVVASKVLLVDDAGNRIILDPVDLSAGRMEVVLPAYLTKGTYRLTAVKDGEASNPLVIGVTPPVEIYAARRLNTTVTVRGSGFGQHLKAADAGLSVRGRRNGESASETARIVSWVPNQIVAQFSAPVDSVEVTTLFHSSKASVTESVTPRSRLGKHGRLSRLLTFLSRWRYR